MCRPNLRHCVSPGHELCSGHPSLSIAFGMRIVAVGGVSTKGRTVGGDSIIGAIAQGARSTTGRSRRGRAMGVVLALAALLIVGAGTNFGVRHFTNRNPGREAVTTSARYTIDSSGGEISGAGYSVFIPPSAILPTDDATLVEASVAVSPLTAESERFGVALGIEHDHPLAAPIEVRWNISNVAEDQRSGLILVRFDENLDVWVADPATLDVPFHIEGEELVASIRDWSFWSWSTFAADLSQGVGEATGTRVEEPSCKTPLPQWVTNTVDPDQDTSAAAIRVCFESDDSGGVTVRVANNRTFFQQLRFVDTGYQFKWTWPGETGFGTTEAVTKTARFVLDNDATYLVPPLTEVAIGLARPAIPGSHYLALEADVNATTMLVDLSAFVLGEVDAGIGDDPVVDAFLEVLYTCGSSQLLDRPDTDADGMVRLVLSILTSCAELIVQRDGEFGKLYEEIALRAVNTEGAAGKAIFEKGNRFAVKAASAFKLLTFGKVAFYASDQLANAFVGNLALSVSARGEPQQLGAWVPTCNDMGEDSNRAYLNIALQDQFADTSKELWQYDAWSRAAQLTAQPLASCSEAYQSELADSLPGSWADPIAAEVLADHIRALSEGGPLDSGGQQPVATNSDAAEEPPAEEIYEVGPITLDTPCLEYLGYSNDERGAAVRVLGVQAGWKDAGHPFAILNFDSHCGQRPNQTMRIALGLFAG